MGNHGSCFSFQSNKGVKLFDAQGNLRQIKETIKVAEIMLEEPGHFISNADELRRTGRVIAMRADDELLPGKVYLLVPATRVNCKVSETEIAIFSVDCKKRKIKRKSSKVTPAGVETEENLGEGKDNVFTGHRNGNHRQWNPVLETILEGQIIL